MKRWNSYIFIASVGGKKKKDTLKGFAMKSVPNFPKGKHAYGFYCAGLNTFHDVLRQAKHSSCDGLKPVPGGSTSDTNTSN
jgi:hypothetical protein